ncbi:MAG: hypothetical protein AAF791_07120 [Bacteroidota bacterium]
MRLTDLEPGETYVAQRDFRDDHDTLVLTGDRFTLQRITPSRGTFAVAFKEETLHLDEERQAEIVEHVDRFLRLA